MNRQSNLFREVSQETIQAIFFHALRESDIWETKLLEGGMFNTTYYVEYGTAHRKAVLRLGWLYGIVVPAGPSAASERFAVLAGSLIATFVTFMAIPVITRGQTIGHMVLRLRVVRPDGSSARSWQYIARYGLLFWVFLLLPNWVSALFPTGGVTLHAGADEVSIGATAIETVLASVCLFWLVTIALRAALSAFKHPFVMLNGVISNTRVMSEAQVERLRAERHAQSLEEELAQNDLGASSLEDAFDSSFDAVYSDEEDAEIDAMRADE